MTPFPLPGAGRFFEEWTAEWPALVSIAFKLLVAALCGVIIGYEREKRGKPAGLKTAVLVVMGACAYVLAAQLAMTHGGGGPSDTVRVISQVVTGIGFLGAGTIMQAKGGITGLTTAAAIWYMGAVGCTVAVGFPLLGLSLSLAALGVLTSLKWAEDRIAHGARAIDGIFVVSARAGSPAEGVLKQFLHDLADHGGGALPLKREENLVILRLPGALFKHLPRDFREELFEAGGLVEMKIEAPAAGND